MVNSVQTSNLREKASHSLLVLLADLDGSRPAEQPSVKSFTKKHWQRVIDGVHPLKNKHEFVGFPNRYPQILFFFQIKTFNFDGFNKPTMFYFSALTGTFPSCYQFNLRGKKKKKRGQLCSRFTSYVWYISSCFEVMHRFCSQKYRWLIFICYNLWNQWNSGEETLNCSNW